MAQEWTLLQVPGFRWGAAELETEFISAQCFVLEVQGQVGAFAALRSLPEAWDLGCFMVGKSSSGQGFGKKFLQGLIDLQRNNAHSHKPFFWLEVHVGNTKAVELYLSCGFKLVGRRSNYYGPGQEALLMSLEIADSR